MDCEEISEFFVVMGVKSKRGRELSLIGVTPLSFGHLPKIRQ